MVKVAGLLLVFACLFGLIAPVYSDDTSGQSSIATDTVGGVVTINGVTISQAEFYTRLEHVPVQSMKAGKKVTAPAGEYIIEQCIEEQMVLQLAEREHVAATADQVDARLAYFRRRTDGRFDEELTAAGSTEEEWRHQMTLQQSIMNLLAKGVRVSDADVRKSYDAEIKRSPSRFVHPEARRIAVIIAKTQARIQKAYNLLNTGHDFGAVALELSEDKTTAPYQGVVGWLSMDMTIVPKPIRSATFALQVGRYSKPFLVQDKSDKAWVIVKMDMKRARTVESFDDMKAVIREQLVLNKADRKPLSKMFQDFIRASKIEVGLERYSDIPHMMKETAASAALSDDLTRSIAPNPSAK